jgi:hypothetical protein
MDYLQALFRLRSVFANEELLTYIGLGFMGAAAITLPYGLKAVWLFLKHGPIESSMKQIGKALLDTLAHIGAIKTKTSTMEVDTDKDARGHVFCSLEGGTSYENSLYLDAFQEILDPIANPKYLIMRKSLFAGIFRKDYHAVPKVIGAKQPFAEYFAKMWKKHVGPTQLVDTRTVEGRKLLLKAHENSLSSNFQLRSERVSCWK